LLSIKPKLPARTKKKLKAAANEHMARLDASPERVKSYFQDEKIKNAT
jgi:hypothetical protein